MRPRGEGSLLAPGLRVVEHLRRGTDLDAYDAFDEARGVRVVVKTPRPDKRRDGKVVDRLLREGRLLQRLAHPHLVRAYDVLEEPRPLVVLETLHGATLGALAEDDPLSPEEAAIVGGHLASALGYLHRNGLLHLDVKPSNVIAEAGRGKLLDLSVARPPGPAPHAGIGTWSYLSPEQARGGELTAAADVWGLGITLHEAITGDAAFDVEGEAHEHPQLHRRAPRLRAWRRGVPKELDALVHATLEPDPAERPTLAELSDGLRALVPPS